jgi:signal transduction histidine kinase
LVSGANGELRQLMLRAPFALRARREARYALAGLAPATLGALFLVLLFGAGLLATASLIGTFVGLLVLSLALRLARGFGGLHRRLAGRLLHGEFPAPPRFQPGRGVLRRVDTRLRDGTGWRALAYVVVKVPVSFLQVYALSLWFTSGWALLSPLWWLGFRNHPPGVQLHPAQVPTAFFVPVPVSSWAGTLPVCLMGAATLLAAPWVLRAVTAGDGWLIRGLLGPAQLVQRVHELEESRALAVDDAAAALRRVERDLHDGAQVRLATLAMGLGMATEKLGEDGQPVDAGQLASVRDLVQTAHLSAKEALIELRDLARGIHPPVLDAGLADALATLAARSLVPVELTTSLTDRPTPAIETIAYFCVAELLANVAKHSGAAKVRLDAAQHGQTLRLRVWDDGAGGADPARGSGLAGLVQRVRTVDGRLELDSPEGGPTEVTIELPLRA